MSYEAYKRGGCHIHVIINYKDKLDVNADEMRIRYLLNKKDTPQHFIDDDKFMQHIKPRIEKSWKIGTVKVEFPDDEEKATRYA
jgi:hypothetical protein